MYVDVNPGYQPLFHPPREKEELAPSPSLPWCCALLHPRALLVAEPSYSQREKAHLSCRNFLRGKFLAFPQIMQRKQNWPMCFSKDNLLFRDPEFMGSSPSPLQEISVDQKGARKKQL